ncbi:type II toxin-antitoxin system RelE/ParE family toxin [Qipengyuania sp. 1NDH17]|uniref:Type II toxin-antitoxin system RelE/ParE family toxin n=1 Tax=Qipengyuania polymorpha TaxID=2867234 RepID=A0ABS7IXM5_9SPHN|nr:type II toxin-antitoxin system RelE/ParE family toxin [Qipengyuania polymorpha]MBX7458312.1 type II toxin-antitoxin system RelE/ParE family toxin [Qipengyuania polymorpha]
MKVSAKDKRIKAILKGHPKPAAENMRGLPRGIAPKIQAIVAQLLASTNLSQICAANPNWRCHEYKGQQGTWSIDVQGSTRLLFEYDDKAHVITGLRYDDPH